MDDTEFDPARKAPPKRPTSLPKLAEEILDSVAQSSGATEVVLGGGIALKHYVDFRSTYDIDAWWRRDRDAQAIEQIKAAMQRVAEKNNLKLSYRQSGTTESLELSDQATGQKVFSFQIAVRDVTLEDAVPSSWPPIAIETLRENIGAKMNALVNRGAPRDFLDVYEVVTRGLLTVEDCWHLWQAKNKSGSIDRAQQDVLASLARIEQRRPLDSLPMQEKEKAKLVREWVRLKLCPPTLG